jgi:hypothetical protein
MLKRTRKVAALGVAALVGAVLVSGAFVTASSNTPAHAACAGGGNPVTLLTYNANWTLVAEESVTYPGTTCNGDSYYSGAVLDPITDGSCAYAYYLEPLAYYALQGVSCTTGAWSVYGYNDTIGTNSVLVSVRPSYLSDSWSTSSGY